MSLADDCERMVRILADAPLDGLSIEEIREKTLSSGDPWSLRTVNDLLCALRFDRGAVVSEKVRRKNGKVTLFRLKGNR